MRWLIDMVDAVRVFLNTPLATLAGSVVTLWALLYFLAAATLIAWVAKRVRRWLVFKLLAESPVPQPMRATAGTVVSVFVTVLGLLSVLATGGFVFPMLNLIFGPLGVDFGTGFHRIVSLLFDHPLADNVEKLSLAFFVRLLRDVARVLNHPILPLEHGSLTLLTLFYVTGGVLGLFYLTARMSRMVVDPMLERRSVPGPTKQAVLVFMRYGVLVLGIFLILDSAGINLSSLKVVAGAVGIGVGFGLQNIANNLVSGLIILFERPVKLGDRIEVGDVEGDVIAIHARATTVVTNDNIAIIVPNSKILTENVINWSYTNEKVRFRLPVRVDYASDVAVVVQALQEAAGQTLGVLTEPAPEVQLCEFGENGLQFELLVWTDSLSHRPDRFRSLINFAIWDRLQHYGVRVPFPQRDVHVRTGTLEARPAPKRS